MNPTIIGKTKTYLLSSLGYNIYIQPPSSKLAIKDYQTRKAITYKMEAPFLYGLKK